MGTITKFLTELRRRRVLSNAALYIVAAWVAIQVASETIDAGLLRIPLRDVFVAAFLGFPVALIVSWYYDFTRQGLVRTAPADVDESFDTTLRKRDYGVLSTLAVAWFVTVLLVHTPIAVDRSVAILPFENLGRDPQNELFAYGIRVDLQTQLQKLHNLSIIARESSDGIDPSMPLSQVGLRLGASYIMKGTVERAFDKVRVSVILVHAESGTQQFAANFDRDLSAKNWFDIRNEIADNIVRTLQAKLSPEEQRQIRAEPTQSLAALNAYGQGMRRKGMRTIASLAEAIGHFRKAIELDPEFALAYVGLADSLYLHQLYRQLPLRAVIPAMKDAVDKAVAIDNELGEAFVTRAVIERVENGDTPTAETYFKRALDLSPNYPVAHHWYGSLLVATGRMEQGLASKRRAQALDPQSAHHTYGVGFTLLIMGRDDEALAQFKAAIELDPAMPGPYERSAEIYAARGRLDEAIIWQQKGVARDPDDWFGHVLLGALFLDIGDVEQAGKWFDRAAELMPPDFPLADGLNEPLLLRRGEIEAALEYSRKNVLFDPQGRNSLMILRDHDLRAGNFDEALSRYESAFPALVTETPPPVNKDNLQIAIDIAPIFLRMGQLDRGNHLLDSSLEVIEAASPGNSSVFGIQRATISALKSDTRAALTALRQTIDEGWRESWWMHLELDSSLDSIRNEPEFQSMLQEIRDDMASQRKRLHELEAAGQLDQIPDPDRT